MSIQNVSDTARWVAVYRAMESERPDALFHDPYARRLAGEEGEKIVNEMKYGRSMAWAMIVRTAVMDELILSRVRDGGVDTVLNLAAGLDTRAWRMALPPTLHWIDVDLPAMSDYKASHMKGETPVCRYDAIAADLTDAKVREALFSQVGASSKVLLVITEGLLIYLDEKDVVSLARGLAAIPSARWWITDIASPMLLQWMRKSWGSAVDRGNAPFKFGPPDSAAFFKSVGWTEKQFRSSGLEAVRLKREMKFPWYWKLLILMMSKKRRAAMDKMAGILLLERA